MSDFIGAPTEDPSETALRNIDYLAFLSTLATRERQIFSCIADGWRGLDIAKKFGISNGRIVQIKRELGKKIREFMGADILNEISSECVWQRDIRMIREKASYYAVMNDDYAA